MPFLDRNGYSLYYNWFGAEDSPVLVLSHSLGTHSGMWRSQIEALGGNFHILVYDHPGHGRSTMRPGRGTIRDYGNDVLALLDSLQVERCHFCGLSLGGMVGLWFGAFAGSRCEKLVVCDAAAKIEDTRLLEMRIREIRRNGLATISGSVIGKWFTSGFLERESATVDEVKKMLSGVSAEAYAMTAETVCQLDLLADLARIENTTLVVYGDCDEATPPAWNLRISDSISGATALRLPAAHLSNIEAAEQFNAGVLRFLTAPKAEQF